jgi:hypothetical protein
MTALYQIKAKLGAALRELYEAAWAAQEWLEEGPAFSPVRADDSRVHLDFRQQPQPQKP